MEFSEEQVMLTLAALAYRGFEYALDGSLDEELVRGALVEGLETFEPVQDNWEIVWGPAATRQVPLKMFWPLTLFDWNSLYVVRHRTARTKYVIAIRGTNPIASQDWLFGDLWVGTAVPWPYGNGNERISTSTALGLASLQALRSNRSTVSNTLSHALAKETRVALHAIARKAENAIKGLAPQKNAHVEELVTRIAEHWIESFADRKDVRAQLQRLRPEVVVEPSELRPKLMPESQRDGNLDLLTFLKTQTDNSSDALDVTVTGHSKGGALAPTVALWLAEALKSDETECWDKNQKATVRFYAFAGPTPGNADFAERVDSTFNEEAHHLINTNDVVPHAFQVDDLAPCPTLSQIPALYGDRTAALGSLVNDLVDAVEHLHYRHSINGMHTFAGKLDPERSFAAELVHQHLDAYLDQLELLSDEINALTCFV